MARYIRNYEVIKELGAGHFGTVYMAVGETPGRGSMPPKRRLVAIKKLKNAADAESVGLLEQEFSLLEQVKHRSVVRVFEYLADENAVVMEYVHGRTLRQVLDELNKAREQVFTESAIEIGCEISDALYQAFTTPGDNGDPLRLVHRDLKPDNVMLTPSGEVKILDWGLARVDNADFAADNRDRIKGTPVYMAPEQARGEAVDHRTDLFALGLILYELLENEAAYLIPEKSRDPVAEVMANIEAANLSEQCGKLERDLPALGPTITRLLQARPSDRYKTGQDLLVDLRRQLYRDRGAYLEEFCEFFFGSICDIGDPPTLDALPKSSRPAPRRSGGRKSIEERLKASMAAENRASSVAGGGARKRPGGAPNGSSPRSSTPRGGPVANSKGKPPRPPVGGAASRATPFKPGGASRASASGNRAPLKEVGQRRPDETGMLEMVPLGQDEDENEAGADPSATAFFAIPAPKAERAKPTAAPPPPPSGGGMGVAGIGMGGAAPPGPPPARAPMGVGAPGMGGQPAGMIQGPVATYNNQSGGSPFQVQGGPSAPPADSDSRTQNTRIFVFLFALFAMGGLVVAAAVWAWVFLLPDTDVPPEPIADVRDRDITGNSTKSKKSSADDDTGEVVAEVKPKTTRKSSSSSSSKKSSSSGSASSAAAAPPPVASGSLTVRLTDPSQATSVEIVCPSGVRQRKGFSGGAASFSGVPAEACTLYFKGGAPAAYSSVKGGMSVNCSIVGTTAVCK